jgi:EpsI family protein
LQSATEDPAPTQPAEFADASTAALLLVGVLVAFAGLGWWLQLRPAVEVDASSIEAVPLQFGEWRGVAEPIPESVVEMLRADAQIQRRYSDAAGDLVWLYVGYYGTERGGRPEHTPWACYPAMGWEISSSSQRPLVDANGPIEGASMVELIVKHGHMRRLVHFWYATHRSMAIASEMGLTVDHLLGRLSASGRADGALVRISTPLDSAGIEAARDRLRRFGGPLRVELDRLWPRSV